MTGCRASAKLAPDEFKNETGRRAFGGGMSSPTQRSLSKLRDEGYLVAITERWNSFSRTRTDLFGFVDVLAIKGNETIAVQTTSGTNVSARIAKIRASESAMLWLASSTRRIIVHGWAKRGPRGKVKRWACRQVEVLLDREVELGQDVTPLEITRLT